MKIQDVMRQMQKAQAEAMAMQDRLAATEATGAAGGEAVKVVLAGDYSVKSVAISPEAFAAGDREMLEDLVRAAFAAAVDEVRRLTADAMGKAMGGLKIPGMPGAS